MKHLRNNILFSLGWLALSEILCLVLAFSFAILRPTWIAYLSLGFGLIAHGLLMGNCGTQIAKQHLVQYRQQKKCVSPTHAMICAISVAIPSWLLLGVLFVFSDSVLALNLFLLLNAPFLQLNRLILSGMEPFSMLSILQKALLAIPPLFTALSFWIGYSHYYYPELARERAKEQQNASSHLA